MVAPLDASEIEFWVRNPRVAFFTASSDIVFEEFCGGVAKGASDLKNVVFFPVTRILSRAFHRVIIISLSLSECNGTKNWGKYFQDWGEFSACFIEYRFSMLFISQGYRYRSGFCEKCEECWKIEREQLRFITSFTQSEVKSAEGSQNAIRRIVSWFDRYMKK